MPNVGSLNVRLTAQTRRFRADMRESQTAVKSFGLGVKRLAGGMAKLGAVGAGVAAAGLLLTTRRALKNIDAMAKLSKNIGVTTERLAGLQHAAELTGAGSELMGKSLGILSKRLGEVATLGKGEAKSGLDAIGLSAEELIQLDAGEAFGKIADAINKLGSQSAKAAVASSLFSRQGIRLVNTLALGSTGLKEMQVEAKALGITFSAFDASKIEQANDSITRLKAVFTGLGNQIAIAVSPLITNMTERLVAFVLQGKGMAGIVGGALEKVSQGVAFMGRAWDFATSSVEGFRVATLQATADFLRGLAKIKEVGGKLINLGGSGFNFSQSDITNAQILGSEIDALTKKRKALAAAGQRDEAARVNKIISFKNKQRLEITSRQVLQIQRAESADGRPGKLNELANAFQQQAIEAVRTFEVLNKKDTGKAITKFFADLKSANARAAAEFVAAVTPDMPNFTDDFTRQLDRTTDSAGKLETIFGKLRRGGEALVSKRRLAAFTPEPRARRGFGNFGSRVTTLPLAAQPQPPAFNPFKFADQPIGGRLFGGGTDAIDRTDTLFGGGIDARSGNKLEPNMGAVFGKRGGDRGKSDFEKEQLALMERLIDVTERRRAFV